jgi:hypothetical protein
MIPDPVTLQKTVTDYFDNLPHPAVPEIKVKDYPAYARVAMMLKGEFADPGDVKTAHAHLQGAGLSPAEFEYLWGIARPIANRFLGRDPHMVELQRLQHAHPAEIHDHYASLPHPKYPEVKAGDYARYWHAAYPLAMQHLKREPNDMEVARFATAGYETDDIHQHYLQGKRR